MNLERLARRVERDGATGCWNWMGATQTHGYGSLGVGGGTTALAHRHVYELLAGPIPDGLTIDHLCMNRRCVNPAHLEPVTNAENQRRRGAAVSACPRGHAYDDANTRINGNGHRSCLTCARAADRERRMKPPRD